MRQAYSGSCHCGGVQFEIVADIDHVRVCDCSICRKRGALNIRIDEGDFSLKTPLAALSLYQWGSRTAEDYFCRVCGILPFRRPRHRTPAEADAGVTPFSGWTINARCLDEIDIDSIPRKAVYGSRL